MADVTDALLARRRSWAGFTSVVILVARPGGRDGRSFMAVSTHRDGDGACPSSAVVHVGLIARLRRKLFGPRLRWECVDCGTVHRSNPKRCSNCGNTILRQKRDD